MIPLITPIPYTVNKILKFSLISLFVLNSINIATPLPVNSPAIHEPNDIVLFRYNSVMATLAPQLGISPIKLDINELNILFFKNNFSIVSSPRYSNPKFNKNDIIIINIVIFNVF